MCKLKFNNCYDKIIQQIYNGPYRRIKLSQRQVIEDAEISELDVGDLVAVHCEHYKELPQIGRVLRVEEHTMEIEWYNGSWSTVWKLAKKRNGKQLVPWTEVIDKADVKLFDFSFTSSGKLRKATIQKLKKEYKLVEQSDED